MNIINDKTPDEELRSEITRLQPSNKFAAQTNFGAEPLIRGPSVIFRPP